jgi:hypothetical protein
MTRITRRLVCGILKERGIDLVQSIHRAVGHEHVAILLSARGHVLEISKNRAGSRSQGCGWSDRSLHAERAVIKKLGNKELLRGSILIVVRLSKVPTHFHGSAPCDDCRRSLQKHIREDKLKAVYYS